MAKRAPAGKPLQVWQARSPARREGDVTTETARPALSWKPIRLLAAVMVMSVQAAAPPWNVAPLAPGPRPVEILEGSDLVCETLRQELTNYWHSNGFDEEPEWRNADVEIPGELGDTQEAIFDFYNNGKLDRVFMSSFGNRYMLGSTLLVQPGHSSSTVDVAVSNPLEDSDTWFIPCQLQGKRFPLKDCPPFSQSNDQAGLTVSWDKRRQHVRFPGRYSDVVPLRLHSRTYLLLTSSSPESRRYAAILRPLPTRTFRTTCLLHQR
jgi:hypothetical protein